MKFKIAKYIIELIDESNYSSRSVDNNFNYHQQYDNEPGYIPSTQIGIKLYEGDRLISNALIKSSGGATKIHKTSQVLNNESITICCSNSIFNLSIPKLSLLWKTIADDVTCFQIFKYQEDYIIHGELNITRLSKNGEILWQNSGADIFVSQNDQDHFEFINDMIQVKDWNNQLYKFDINGKLLS